MSGFAVTLLLLCVGCAIILAFAIGLLAYNAGNR